MEKYNGNQKGFIYVSCDAKDLDKVLAKYLEPLAADGVSFWWADVFDKKEEKTLARAKAVLLVLTKDYAKDKRLRATVAAAVKSNKPLLCVYLEEVELDAALSMQTEAQQALYVSKYKSDEDFVKELKKAAIFESLEASKEQKGTQKKRSFAVVAAAVVVLIAAIVIIKPLLSRSNDNNAMEVLELQGLSKEDLASVEELYVVGSEVMDHDAAARYEDGDTSVIVYEVSDDETQTTPAGSISDLSGMGQLENLKVLQLSGQQLEEVGELGELQNLQALILSCNPLNSLDGAGNLDLEVLDISYTDVEELPDGMHVREINADGSKLRKIPDFGGLSDVELYAGDTLISDISNIGTAENYTDLHIDCGNADISQIAAGLKGIPVETLALTNMQATDLTVLSGIDADEVTSLGLGAGTITSLEGIEHFENVTDLQLEYCDQLTDLSELNKLPRLERVRLSRSMSALAAGLDDRIEIEFED